jgi:hypothetical protein
MEEELMSATSTAPTSGTTTSSPPLLNLSIGLSDLTGGQLKSLLQGNAQPLFTFATEIAPYWGAAVQTVPNGTSVMIQVSGSGNWKTSSGVIGFALSGSAKCQMKVITSGAVVKYAPNLKSQATSELPASPYPGSAYVVLSLDFQISGSVSGSGNVSGLGISGNVKGSSDTSVQFCHQVSGGIKLSDAIKETFETFVFALEPECATDIAPNDIAQVNFNGSLACGVNLSYGITNVSFAAPGVASALASATQGMTQFTLPSGKIAIGAEASFNYTHSDDFNAMVQKLDAGNAFLYVMRAHKNDASEGLSVSAKVTITQNASVKVDPQKLQTAVTKITGGPGANQVGNAVSTLEQKLNDKLDTWINDTVSKGATLGLTWDQSKAVSMLFKYQIDVTNSALLQATWNALCNGDLLGAAAAGGLVPEAGSGVSSEIDRSFTINLQFFNLFSVSSKTTYFDKTYVVVTPNGALRYMYDIGKESDVEVNKSKSTCNMHFVATVDEATAKTVSHADVSLVLEIAAMNNRKEAGRIGDLVGMIPPNQQVNEAQKSMQRFVAANPSGTLDLICVLTSSAYGRLSCSEFVGKKPPANQQQDSENWGRFHDACESLLNLQFVEDLSYGDWQRFNVVCVYGTGISATPDRHQTGNLAKVPSGMWPNISAPGDLIGYFLLNSAEFMNLCDDLHELAGLSTAPNTSSEDVVTYNSLLSSLLELIVKRDVNTDYSKPAVGGLLRLSNPQNVASQCVTGKNTLTCTLTLN